MKKPSRSLFTSFAALVLLAAPLSAWSMELNASTEDSGPATVSIRSADPDCDPAHSVTFHALMEFQVGLWAWEPAAAWDVCVNDGGTSQITVNFKNEPYQAIITINGSHATLAPPADAAAWALVFTRQDLIDGKPSAQPRPFSFVLEPRHRERFVMKGVYSLQECNLRFTISD